MSTVSVSDSRLLGRLFASAEVADAFGDRARLQAMLDFEAALAEAEAGCGLIPAEAPAAIRAACDAALYDVAALGEATALAANPAIPLVKALTEKVEGEAARFVHWGSTSQDVIDTGLALQMRAGIRLVAGRARTLGEALAQLTEAHRATPAIARTVLQHAAPIPFGLRTAGWLAAAARGLERLAALERDCLRLHFFGAFGSLASLGRDGPAVAARLSQALGLPLATLSLHGHRDFVAEIASGLAIVCGAAAKIATDIERLMQTDVAEAFEPAAPGKGGSSAMPHKRNPVSSIAVVANYRQAAALASGLISHMDHAFERDAGNWHAEWGPLAELFVLTGGALERLGETVAGLELDTAAMRANIDRTDGLVFAEAVTTALAPAIGRSQAHHLVEQACRQAVAERRHLRDVLLASEAVTSQVTEHEIVDAFDPVRYFGAADHFIDRALAAWRDARAAAI